jgi:alcohol dehydrogenase
VLHEPYDLRRAELPLPTLGADDGLLRVEACGLCGTDHEQFSGALPIPGPLVPGHEVVGTVAALGPEAARRWGVRAGDRVAVEVFQSCRQCDACRAGLTRRCTRHGLGDMVGFIPVDRPPGLWGGYSQWLYLPPDAVVLPVPAGLDPVVATLFNPLGAGIRWAVELPGTAPGASVAVLGPGIRGLASLVAALGAGATYVAVTGAGPADRSRLELARRLGAHRTVDVRVEDPVAAVHGDLGSGVDIVVDVTAKAPDAARQAVALARPGGAVVLAGTRGRSGASAPGIDPDLVVAKELRLLGALGVDAPSYQAALSFLAEDEAGFSDVPRECVGLDGLPDLLGRLARRDASGAASSAPVHAVVQPWRDD